MSASPNRLSGFARFARAAARASGRPAAFVGAVLAVVIWAALGPLFSYSDSWQLVINTGTTIATFLMVFLIQNTQNRDTDALQIKLDELIRVAADAENGLLVAEGLDDDTMKALRVAYERLAKAARKSPEECAATAIAK